MNLMDTGVLSQINLPPTLLFPECSDTFAKQNANISCHSAILRLVFTLNLAHTLFAAERMLDVGRIEFWALCRFLPTLSFNDASMTER
jgi:hypothetical protein